MFLNMFNEVIPLYPNSSLKSSSFEEDVANEGQSWKGSRISSILSDIRISTETCHFNEKCVKDQNSSAFCSGPMMEFGKRMSSRHSKDHFLLFLIITW